MTPKTEVEDFQRSVGSKDGLSSSDDLDMDQPDETGRNEEHEMNIIEENGEKEILTG